MTGLEKLLRWHSMRGGISTQDATAAGNPATFETTLIRPLKACAASFLPVQPGSGDPSPSNIRPVTGWTGLTVYHSGEDTSSPDEILVEWETEAGTVYGGTVDPVTGELYATCIRVPNSSLQYSSNSGDWLQIVSRYMKGIQCKSLFSDRASMDIPSGTVGRLSLYSNNLYANMAKSEFTTMDDDGVQAWADEHDPQFFAELQEPVLVTTLAPQRILALNGYNTIWSSADANVNVTYVTKG